MEPQGPLIRASFLGVESASLDGEILHFPYEKARLLFFLLLEARRVERERLCTLLWDERPETARQNLRNALSALRRLLPEDCLSSDRRAVWFAGDCVVRSDLDELTVDGVCRENVERLSRPFMEGVASGEAEFRWLEGRRRYYREKLLNIAVEKIKSAPQGEKSFWRLHASRLSDEESPDGSAPPPGELSRGELAQNLEDAVSDRAVPLSGEEAELLDCVAVFPGEAPFDALKELAGLNDPALIRLYESLHRKGLLCERQSEDDHSAASGFCILFQHPPVKERVREAMPRVKWWSLHRRLLAQLKRERLADGVEMGVLPLLARHAGDPMAELDARVNELKTHFEFSHELFPMLSDADLLRASRGANDTLVTGTYLGEAQELLNKLLRTHGRVARLVAFERTLLALQGSYLRWNGRYADAEGCLEEALRLAVASPTASEKAQAEVLEQFCYLGIQRDAADVLQRYVLPFYRSAMKAQLHPEAGMALRFLAILGIMEGDYDRATKLLGMSIRLFERLESCGEGHTLGVIAATHYHGDIALHRSRYAEALAHYRQCVKLCEGKGFYRGLGLLLAKGAWCAARLGDVADARSQLALARPLFEGFRSRRGAAMCAGEIVFGLSALFDLGDGAAQRAQENLRYAEELGRVIQKPLWSAILHCIKAALKTLDAALFGELLPLSAEDYLTQARTLFEKLNICGEIEACGQLKGMIDSRLHHERADSPCNERVMEI